LEKKSKLKGKIVICREGFGDRGKRKIPIKRRSEERLAEEFWRRNLSIRKKVVNLRSSSEELRKKEV